jgi:hypothetical protein
MRLFACMFICLIVSVALANAENTKTNITTASGLVYTNVVVQRVEPDGITLMTRKGMTKIPFSGLTEDLQKQYNYNPSNAVAYAQKMSAAQANYSQAAAKTNAAAATKPKDEAESETTNSVAGDNTTRTDRKGALRSREEMLVHTPSGD